MGIKKTVIIIISLLLVISLIGCTNPDEKIVKVSNLVEEGEYEKAIDGYLKIINKHPEHANTYLELANLYNIMGESKLEKEILEQGIRYGEFSNNLKVALGKYHIRYNGVKEAERLLLEVLDDYNKHLGAYETLIELYYDEHDYNMVNELFEKYRDNIKSDLAIAVVSTVHLRTGGENIGLNMINSIDIDKVNDSKILELMAYFYEKIGDKGKALKVAEKGLTSNEPALFHGYIYSIKNKEGLALIQIQTGDVNGDGNNENVLLMAEESDYGYHEDIRIVIQNAKNGAIIDSIDIDYGGYPYKLQLSDLNNDGALDILASIHSGGSGGYEDNYIYSFKNNQLEDLLHAFEFKLDYQFLDDYRVQIFAEDIKKLYLLELDSERKTRYTEEGYYKQNGMLIEPYLAYFKYNVMDSVYIAKLDKYGIEHNIALAGPSFNADEMASIQVTYVLNNNVWEIYDFDVESYAGEVKEMSYDENRKKPKYAENGKKPKYAEDFEFLHELFSLSREDLFVEYGEPVETGYYGVEYLNFGDIIFFHDGYSISSIWFFEGHILFDLDLEARRDTIINTLGKPIWEEYNYDELEHVLYYEVGKYSVYFVGDSPDSKFYMRVKK